MSKPSKRFLIAGGLVLGVLGSLAILAFVSLSVLFLFPFNRFDNQSPTRLAEMKAILFECGRLAPLPGVARDFSIRTEGNEFTRSFRASFAAPEQDLRKWVADSPGLRDTNLETTGDGTAKYIINPGCHANYAHVLIDAQAGTVEVYVSFG
jgi:hypothetical protein